MWVAPVLEEGARERRTYLPQRRVARLLERRALQGGREVTAVAPLDRIPIWVRRGSIVVTYPAEAVRRGLEDSRGDERPLEATLWGEPRCGRAKAVLADGSEIRWRTWEVGLPSRIADVEVRRRSSTAADPRSLP